MGGREKPKGDRLRRVRQALHEKSSRGEALQRLVSKLAKDEATAAHLKTLAAQEGIEKLTIEARRLGLLDGEPLIVTPKSGTDAWRDVLEREVRAIEGELFKREVMGAFPSREVPPPKPIDINMEAKPLTFEMFDDARRKSMAYFDRDDMVDAASFAVTSGRRHGKSKAARAAHVAAKLRGVTATMAIIDDPMPSMRASTWKYTPGSVVELAAKWEWGVLSTTYFLMYVKDHHESFDAMEWGHLKACGLGSVYVQVASIITKGEQKKRLERNLARIVENLRELIIKAYRSGRKINIEDRNVILPGLLGSEPDWLPKSAFSITKNITIDDDTEIYRVMYTVPVLDREYVATQMKFSQHAIRQMMMGGSPTSRLQTEQPNWQQVSRPDPMANLPQGPPEKMSDNDFANAFQQWMAEDDE